MYTDGGGYQIPFDRNLRGSHQQWKPTPLEEVIGKG